MDILDYEILVQEIKPPIGKVIKYCAVIQFVSIKTDDGHKKIYPDLGETQGSTQDEARQKLQLIYEAWVKSIRGQSPF